MIGLPKGTHKLDRRLFIKRPRLVLRGAGRDQTILRIDRPLNQVPGVPDMPGGYGYFSKCELPAGLPAVARPSVAPKAAMPASVLPAKCHQQCSLLVWKVDAARPTATDCQRGALGLLQMASSRWRAGICGTSPSQQWLERHTEATRASLWVLPSCNWSE